MSQLCHPVSFDVVPSLYVQAYLGPEPPEYGDYKITYPLAPGLAVAKAVSTDETGHKDKDRDETRDTYYREQKIFLISAIIFHFTNLYLPFLYPLPTRFSAAFFFPDLYPDRLPRISAYLPLIISSGRAKDEFWICSAAVLIAVIINMGGRGKVYFFLLCPHLIYFTQRAAFSVKNVNYYSSSFHNTF